MGVVVADYDNDGWDDIYVTGYGPDYLFRNRGDRTFAEVGVQAGVQDPRWSVGAAFADIPSVTHFVPTAGSTCSAALEASPAHATLFS